ncbi:MAG TPA: glutaredoxin domain-containing protein [Candidatus Magasanikbacteria bacterium]|nr:glutaredoxin domain-containing protein [Candidatus Magasanikbacteria bacterium]
MMINIYSTPTCPYCHMVKDYLKGKGVEFNDYNVAEDQAKAQEMVEKSGQMGVPVIEIDNNIIVGFDKPEIDRLLNL